MARVRERETLIVGARFFAQSLSHFTHIAVALVNVTHNSQLVFVQKGSTKGNSNLPTCLSSNPANVQRCGSRNAK